MTQLILCTTWGNFAPDETLVALALVSADGAEFYEVLPWEEPARGFDPFDLRKDPIPGGAFGSKHMLARALLTFISERPRPIQILAPCIGDLRGLVWLIDTMYGDDAAFAGVQLKWESDLGKGLACANPLDAARAICKYRLPGLNSSL